MLNKKTVFVIGAGAGDGLNMPLGADLSGRIARAVNFRFEKRDLAEGEHQIWRVARNYAVTNEGKNQDVLIAGRQIAQGIEYSRSIDNYVHTHSDKELVKVIAKAAISFTILEAENKSALWCDYQKKFREEDKVRTSWLPDFFSVLSEGVIESKNLDEVFDNLTIVNFNYDRCIEQFIFIVMLRLFPSKGERYMAELLNRKLKIYHPYGVVGRLPWQEGGPQLEFGCEEDRYDLGEVSKSIRTYNEEVDDREQLAAIGKALREAQRVVFLGFHFHNQNVMLLGQEGKDLSGPVEVYSTQVGRSPADLRIIESVRLPKILHGRRMMTISSFTEEMDCKSLFRRFGIALSG